MFRFLLKDETEMQEELQDQNPGLKFFLLKSFEQNAPIRAMKQG